MTPELLTLYNQILRDQHIHDMVSLELFPTYWQVKTYFEIARAHHRFGVQIHAPVRRHWEDGPR